MERNEPVFTCNLIRHAESEFNKAQKESGGAQAVTDHAVEDIEIKFTDKLFDCGITELGIQ